MKPSLASPIWSWATLCLAVVFIAWGMWLVITAHGLQAEVVRGFNWAHQLNQIERALRALDEGLQAPSEASLQPEDWPGRVGRFHAEASKLLGTYAANRDLQEHVGRMSALVRRLEEAQPALQQPALPPAERRRLMLAFQQDLHSALDETTSASQTVQQYQEALTGQLAGKWRALTMVVMVSCVLAIFLALLSNMHLREIAERQAAEARLRQYRDQLENLVKERTLQVDRVNEQLKDELARRQLAEEVLRLAYDELERRVDIRTTELVEANASLQREILERRRAEDDLREAETKYRSIFESAVEGIYQTTPDGRFLAANPSLARMWGYNSPADLLANLTDVERQLYVDPGRRAVFKQLIETHGAIHGFEYQIYRRDRSVIWVSEHALAIRGPDGQVLHYEGTIQDITERKRAEEALRASELKYRYLIENLEQCIFLKDRDLRYLAANQPFCNRLGRIESDVIGKTDLDLFPEHLAAKYRTDDLLVLSEGRHVEAEEESLDHGSSKLVRVIKTAVRDGQGQIVGVLGIFWDVTEQRLLEMQLRQAQKMEAIGRLAGGVAHDFNNLLTIILGNLSMALAALPEGDEKRDLLAIAEQAAVRAAELTRQLLGFSRRAILRPESLSLNLAVQDTLQILRRTIDPRIAVEVDTEEHLWTVRADRAQMGQVLMNLCLNARDAMSDGGRLTLETSNVLLDEEYVRRHLGCRPGEFVRLRVSDTGHGIPDEVRAQIFEPFFTTKGPGKGTGLGLAMVFGIVRQHQGWIDCHSEVGKGTSFDIYLPRHDESSMPLVERAGTAGAARGQETVLLVDDEEHIRALGAAALQRYGYRVIVAEDGLQAIDLYLRQKEHVDLIILDLTMPHLSGRDTLAQLVLYDPDVSVLVSSGYTAESLTAAETDQTLGFLCKPYRPEDLAAAVRQALNRAKGRASRQEPAAEPSLA